MDGNELTSRINELGNLLAQIGDPVARHAAGALSDDGYAEQRARQLAYTAALARLGAGEEVDDDALAGMLDEMRDVVAQPTQEEINAANIDYLLMIGGEE